MVAMAACGGDDDTDDTAAVDVAATVDPNDQAAVEEQLDDEAASSSDAVDLPSDYPLPAPDGGTVSSAIIDDATSASNIVVVYPMSALDELVARYDEFFDSQDGETVRVPLTDGLASWQNDAAGYSVIVNAQNVDIQVRLQTGI